MQDDMLSNTLVACVTFKMCLSLTAPSSVTNLSSTGTVDPGATNVTVTWTAPETVVIISEYHVQYRERGKNEWINATPVTGSPPPTSVTLTGLVPNTEYVIRVRAVSAGVPGNWSEELTVRTKSKFYVVSVVMQG